MQKTQGWQLLFPLIILVLVMGLIAYTWPATHVEPLPVAGSVEEARALAEAGQLTEARALLETLLLHTPEDAEAHFYLGWVCLRLEDAPCAEAALHKALQLDPQRAAAVHHNLGVLAFEQGKLDEALAEFQAALQADPDDLDTRYQLGAVYLVLSIPPDSMLVDTAKLDLAVAQFEQVLDADPNKVEALVGLGNARLIEGRYDESISLLERAVNTNPIPEALFALGRAYAVVGRAGEARVTLQRFLDTQPPAQWAEQAQALLGQLEP